jgi:alkane 1-monooxygenase
MTQESAPGRVAALARGACALFVLALFTLLPLASVRLGLPWLPLAVTFVLVPLLDAWVGAAAPGRKAFDLPRNIAVWLPRAQVPLQAVLLVGALMYVPQLPLADVVLFAFAVGTVTGGIGITVAHELGHRATRLDRALSKALLVSVGYGHFFVEHNRGHHARVATADDPASAPRGMRVYRFMLRSAAGGFRHAWRLEAMRLRRLGCSVVSPSNWTLSGTLLWLALGAYVAASLGAGAVAFLVAQALWAVALLEIVNYIEHYGLRRARRADGRPEPVAPQHSWNADFIVSNWLLFNLQLHSDHHAHVERPFERLRSMPQAPQLPAGYPTMVLLALLPPLWFAVMDRRLPRLDAQVRAAA